IKQKEAPVVTVAQAAPQVYNVAPTAAPMPLMPSAAAPDSAPAATVAPAKTDNLITIKSPMIGTFYRKYSPDKPSFVEVGDEV
ncbi:hypothetical protein ABTM68_20815, partial [Acinetobacter baumannii]